MALDEVAAEARTDLESALDVDGVARGEGAEIGEAEGLLEEIEVGGVGRGVDDGKAAAVDGDAFAEGEVGGEGNGGECEAGTLGSGLEVRDAGGGFDDSSEHEEKGIYDL